MNLKVAKRMMDTYFFMIIKLGVPVLIFIVLAIIVPFFFFNDQHLELALSSYLGNETRIASVEALLELMEIKINYVISIFITVSLLKYFRKSNKEKYFNANGTIYYEVPYFFFWFASTILGYEKIQLAGIPLHMQYKLVLRGTFQTIVPDMWNDHYPKADIDISEIDVKPLYNCECSNSVNLLIVDTYDINIDELSKEYKNNPTIIIRNTSLDTQRKINEPLIAKVRSEVVKLSRDYQKIYVFSTANPVNNIKIINSSFRFFGRVSNLNLYVVQKNDAQGGEYEKSFKIF
jgi:hypothetical protein